MLSSVKKSGRMLRLPGSAVATPSSSAEGFLESSTNTYRGSTLWAKHCASAGNITTPRHHPHSREPLVLKGRYSCCCSETQPWAGLAIQLAAPLHRLIWLQSTPLQHEESRSASRTHRTVPGVPVITHHMGLELFTFTFACSQTQKLSLPLTLRLSVWSLHLNRFQMCSS